MPYFELDGLKLYYEEHGSGTPLLLLQGNSASSAHMKLTGDAAYFQQYARVILFDYRGTGKSTRLQRWPADWYARCAQDAAMLLMELQAPPCKIIGSSGGAFIAFWLAALFPELVQAVVAESFRLDIAHYVKELIQQTRSNYTAGQKKFWKLGHGLDWRSVIQADTAFLQRMAEEESGPIMDIPYSKIRCPVFLCGSAQDDLIPDMARQLALAREQIPQAEVYLHESGGHPLMWSEPQIFRDKAVRFLELS